MEMKKVISLESTFLVVKIQKKIHESNFEF